MVEFVVLLLAVKQNANWVVDNLLEVHVNHLGETGIGVIGVICVEIICKNCLWSLAIMDLLLSGCQAM